MRKLLLVGLTGWLLAGCGGSAPHPTPTPQATQAVPSSTPVEDPRVAALKSDNLQCMLDQVKASAGSKVQLSNGGGPLPVDLRHPGVAKTILGYSGTQVASVLFLNPSGPPTKVEILRLRTQREARVTYNDFQTYAKPDPHQFHTGLLVVTYWGAPASEDQFRAVSSCLNILE